jgi:hypothetical protein
MTDLDQGGTPDDSASRSCCRRDLSAVRVVVVFLVLFFLLVAPSLYTAIHTLRFGCPGLLLGQ